MPTKVSSGSVNSVGEGANAHFSDFLRAKLNDPKCEYLNIEGHYCSKRMIAEWAWRYLKHFILKETSEASSQTEDEPKAGFIPTAPKNCKTVDCQAKRSNAATETKNIAVTEASTEGLEYAYIGIETDKSKSVNETDSVVVQSQDVTSSSTGRVTWRQHNQHQSYSYPPPSSSGSPLGLASPPPTYHSEKKKNYYNPPTFDMSLAGARFFVIKSYSKEDIHRSIQYKIWCSTDHGNRRLDEAWKEQDDKGPIFLFFSVNGSGHFCGMAQMMSDVDYNASSSVWSSHNKWKGQFKVKWIYAKDVPNYQLRHIRLENNENKSVTRSRDIQEVPWDKGKQVLKVIHTYPNTTSIFDDFKTVKMRIKIDQQQPPPSPSA